MYDMGRLAQSMFSRASVWELLPFEQKIWHHFLLFDGQELGNDHFAELATTCTGSSPKWNRYWRPTTDRSLPMKNYNVYWLPLLTVTGRCSRNTVCFQWVGMAWGPVENITYTAIQERIMNIYCVSSNNIQGHLFKKVATPENWFITNMEMDCHQGWIRKNIYLEKF